MFDLLPENVRQTLEHSNVRTSVFPCEPEFADTAGLIGKYGYPLEQCVNTIIVVGRSEPRTFVACAVLATHKVDVNKRVRQLLDVKSASFASGDQTVELTGMMIGGVTVFGLPPNLPIWVDGEVFNAKEIMVGGGNRSAKLILDPAELRKLPNVQEVAGLGIRTTPALGSRPSMTPTPTAKRDEKSITAKSVDFDRWYTDVVRRAELADYTPVKGCMVIRPYGYALWENIQAALDAMIKRTGHENMYFPLLIPESYLKKEAEHVEGFAPEVAWVTHGGSKQLEERLAIRPTSETIICSLYADWIHSWRDLPVLINQWANVVRWEKRTRLFLRTTEFLWQEGHTFHAAEEEAAEEVDRMLDCYRELAEDWLCMPVIAGRKTESEKFAGARYTLSIEAMMSDGWALQAGTSHHHGQNFATAYGIAYTDRSNERQTPHQTAWGLSTRIVGGLIMAHGDDAGLIMPPRVAPVQVIIVPITRSNDEESTTLIDEACATIEREAPGVRVKVDRRDARPGEKYAHWELRGVPLRIAVGARDLADGNVTVIRRVDGRQTVEPVSGLGARLQHMLDDAHQATWDRAHQLLADRSVDVATLDELKAAFAERSVFASAPFCNRAECENAIKAAVHAATVRNLRDDRAPGGKPCLVCAREATSIALIARAY